MSEKVKRDNTLIAYFPSFLLDKEKKGFALSGIRERERSLEFFKQWLIKEQIQDIFPEQLEKKHIQKYRKHLQNQQVKDAAIKKHLKTIHDLLEYLEDKGIVPPLPQNNAETDIQKIVNHYFKTKGFSLEEIKKDTKKRKIIYSRYTKPAKDLLELTGSVQEAKKAMDKVALWAKSRNLDYAIETVFKKWPEIENLKPKEKKNKPYFRGDPMVWSKTKRKWFVISRETGDWLEFAGKEEDIEWKEEY